MKILQHIRYISVFLMLVPLFANGQTSVNDFEDDIIPIRNGSFEDIPHKGGSRLGIRDWRDCGRISFPRETPPDIHPKGFWENYQLPSDGESYLGMVVRDNDTHEFISQRLVIPLEAGKCYSISMEVCRSPNYKSFTKTNQKTLSNYTKPAVLRIWGSPSFCGFKQLLSETPPVKHDKWQTYTFDFESKFEHRYIVLEAFYKTPVLNPYNGHVLLDNLSDIRVIPCPSDDEEEIVMVAKPKKFIPPHKKKKKPVVKKPVEEVAINTAPTVRTTKKKTPVSSKKRILTELDKNTIRKGQKIKIEKLFFAADTSSINSDSYAVLDEVYHFLKENPGIKVEIGGHTNNTPLHKYCDKLSTDRAKEVASYLVKKGIDNNRLQFKGYGKRKPIATNKTKKGRAKNQRVEIKILSLS